MDLYALDLRNPPPFRSRNYVVYKPLLRTSLSFLCEHGFALMGSMDTNLHEECVVLGDDDLPDLTQILRLHILQVVQGRFITKHL